MSRHNHVPSLLIGVMSTAESRLMSGLSLVVVVVIVDGGSAVFDVVEVRMLHRLACRYTTTRFVSEHPLQHVIPHKSPNIHYLQHTSDDSTKHEMRLLRMTKQTNVSLTSTRSTPSSHKHGTTSARFRGDHCGNDALKSANLLTPGQSFSFGVPTIS